MGLFKKVEGAAAITITGGVYKQVDVYERDEFLYAKDGAGFVRLYKNGSTTKANVRFVELHCDYVLCSDGVGRLCTAGALNARQLPGCIDNGVLLIGNGNG